MKRGDVVWFEPDPVRDSEQRGRRPAVIVSRDIVIEKSPVVIVVPLTTYRGQTLYPSDVLIHAAESGFAKDAVAMALHLRAVDKERLGRYIGHLRGNVLRRLERAILQVLDIQCDSPTTGRPRIPLER